MSVCIEDGNRSVDVQPNHRGAGASASQRIATWLAHIKVGGIEVGLVKLELAMKEVVEKFLVLLE